MPSNRFAQHCREIAQRFLLTAVVVDDEISVPTDLPVHGNLTIPGRNPTGHGLNSVDGPPPPPMPLKINPITWSFARQGMVCGVVSPQEGENGHDALVKAVARADIVILDWRLSRRSGANSLPLLNRIFSEDPRDRLRLIAFYTGEPDLEAIRTQISASLNSLDASDQTVFTRSHNGAIDFRACRIVVYRKPGLPTSDSSCVVDEEKLANQLIADFANMVEGLLPTLVLTALTAVRDNVYMMLERFGVDLDPAFLAHRACLPQPPESEQHIVEQIASELQGIMDDAVSRASPAGIEVIEHWLTDRFDNDQVVFSPKHKVAVPAVLKMLKDGLKQQPGSVGLRKYHLLSHGFSRGADNSRELDRRFASAMSFRQVLEDTPRQLMMGTVIRRVGTDDETILVCVTPRCDSVRLVRESKFLFLPLSDPEGSTLQVVVPINENEHRRMTISMNPSEWCTEDFSPDPERNCVLAHDDGPEQTFIFKDVRGREYCWLGELKIETAQAIAQAIAERMSRMPLNKSEWLRRSERFGTREN